MSHFIKFLGQAVNRSSIILMNILMIIIFTIVILVSADAVFRAYLDIHYEGTELRQTLAELENYIKNIPTNTNHQLSPETEIFLDKIKNQSNNNLSSETITFLFQIFTLCLFTAGVYLLTLIQKYVQKAYEKVSQITSFIASFPASTIIMSYLIQAYQTTWLLRTEKDNKIQISHITHARDIITKLLIEAIHKARNEKIGIEPSHYDTYLDLIQYIKENLERFKKNNKNKKNKEIDNLIQACNRCEALLDPELKDNYQKQLEILLEK
jgi:hypothetical protein